jgi:hypothetical protein
MSDIKLFQISGNTVAAIEGQSVAENIVDL